MGRLNGRVALITGAGGGIGAATVQRFLEEGARVCAADFSDGALETLRSALEGAAQQTNDPLLVTRCDVSNDESVERACAEALRRFGRIDILVNCAGGSSDADAPITEVGLDVFKRTIDVDLLGTMLCCRHAIPAMIQAGGGAIVNLSSWSALQGRFPRHIYMAAKGGVISFTRGLASEYAQKNIRANAIAPGSIRTARTIRRHAGANENDPRAALRKRMASEYPFSVGEPVDVANIAVFLASDESRMITGQTIAADGGRSAY